MRKAALIIIFSVAFFFQLQKARASDDLNPMFVTITTKDCYTCQKLKPVIEELKNEYSDKVSFIALDVSSKASLDEAREKAISLGIENFFNDKKAELPSVGIVCPGGTKIENTFSGETNKEVYEEALNKLLVDASRLCSL